MPCVVCGQLLAVRGLGADETQTHLFCPQCEGLEIESQSVVRSKTKYLIQDSEINAARIPHGLGDYKKEEVLYLLIHRINRHINKFFERNGMYSFEFGYLASLIYSVYRASGFGNRSIPDFEEFWEDVTIARDGFAKLHSTFLDAYEGFLICERNTVFSGEFNDFASDYSLYPSEYSLGFRRILAALVCRDPADWDTFTTVTDEIRNFRDIRISEEPETVEEYGDFWYQFINQLKVVASMDPIINDVYSTRFPDEITIFQVEQFIEELNNSLSPTQVRKASKGICVALDRKTIETAGEKAFNQYWEEVRPLVIVSKDNIGAHPFIFKINYTEEYSSAEKDEQVSVKKEEYLYPRDYARLAKFQIFPLLRNKGTGDSGHRILKKMTDKRASKYEKQFYEFLKSRSVECHLRPEISNSDGSELDIIYVTAEEIHLVELKLFMPPPELRSREGITTVNQKFDLPIFNEETEDVSRTASGPTLPEKLQKWRELEQGDVFYTDDSFGTDKDHKQRIGENWWDKNIRQFVVSNLTPSYTEKKGIRFITDFEYVKLVDGGDEGVIYPIWDGREEQNRSREYSTQI